MFYIDMYILYNSYSLAIITDELLDSKLKSIPDIIYRIDQIL